MSSFEYIFYHTDLPPEAVTECLARLPGMRLEHTGDGRVFVSRPCASGHGSVGGEVTSNEHRLAGQQTALDGYDTVYEIHVKHGDRDTQFTEAERVFAESTTTLGWPALLVRNLDLITAAWSPELGLTRFPDDTTPDDEHRSRWQPVVIHAPDPDH